MKRTLAIVFSCLLLTAVVCAQDSLEKTKERAEKAKPADCAKVCFEAAKQLVEASNQLYLGGDNVAGLKMMNDALSYAQRGTEAALESRKHQKNAEISLRKIGKRMHDVGQSLSFEDRPPVFAMEKQVEGFRDQMLNALFGNPPKSFEEKKR